jgi:hypothetical protein
MLVKRIKVEAIPRDHPDLHALQGIQLVPASRFAAMLGVSSRTLWNYEAKGVISPAKRINGRKYWDINERPRFDDPESIKRRFAPKAARDTLNDIADNVEPSVTGRRRA